MMAVPNWFLSSLRSVLSTQPNTPSRQSNWFVNNQRNTHVQDWSTTSLMEKFNGSIKSGTYRVLAVMTSKRALIFKILIICLTGIKDQESQIYLSTCLRISYLRPGPLTYQSKGFRHVPLCWGPALHTADCPAGECRQCTAQCRTPGDQLTARWRIHLPRVAFNHF